MQHLRPIIGVIFMLVCRTSFPRLSGCNIKPHLNGHQLLWLLVCDVKPLLPGLWGHDIRPHLAHSVVLRLLGRNFAMQTVLVCNLVNIYAPCGA